MDCWSEGATTVLIDAWAERYVELSRGILKEHHWKEVTDVVSSREDYIKPPKIDIQCKNRIDTLIGLNPSSSRKPAASKPPLLSRSVRVFTGIPVGKRSSSHRNLQNGMNNGRQKLKTSYR
ncbi:Trihelix transcription factor ASIL2 [Linum perenne]